jgi:hypothetical protein
MNFKIFIILWIVMLYIEVMFVVKFGNNQFRLI